MVNGKKSAQPMTEERLTKLYWWWHKDNTFDYAGGWKEIGRKFGIHVFHAETLLQYCAYKYEVWGRKKRGTRKCGPPNWLYGKSFNKLTTEQILCLKRRWGSGPYWDKIPALTIPDVLETSGPDNIVLPLKIRPDLTSEDDVLQRIAGFLKELMKKKNLQWGGDRKKGRRRTSKLAWKTLEDADRMAHGLPCLSGNTEPQQAVRRLLRDARLE